MNCLICASSNLNKVFSHKVLKKHDVDYFLCINCGFIQTEEPFWLTEAYGRPITISDTGYVSRNLNLAKKAWLLFVLLFGKKKSFLDYAGGYGLFTRLMRDFGLDFYTTDKYAQNSFAAGFDYKEQKISAVTCFECFEHFSQPNVEIDKILSISKNIFFSTTLFNGISAPDISWDYYGFEHGQHISFYSLKTLKYIAIKKNLFLCSDGKRLHLFLEKKISNFVFVLLIKLGLLPWDIFYRIIVKSKTMTDYYLLKKL